MQVTVRCFAMVRELLGAETMVVEVADGTTVAALKHKLGERFDGLHALQVACAVNRDYAEPERVLVEGDEVAFIPPISGGAATEDDGGDAVDSSGAADLFRFDLVEGVLDSHHLEREVRTDADGAVVTFSGVTRDHNEGRSVVTLSYEAYGEMARKVVHEIFELAMQRFEFTRARVAHRLGEVPIGEASIVVIVAAPHRGPAFDACRFLMDRIKTEAPIFKREQLADGDGGHRWVGDLPTGKPST